MFDDESIEARRRLYADIFEHLASADWSRGATQIAWDFNTASDANNTRHIKGNEAYYYGNSQGGIMGTVFMALSPDVERGALGVMGQPYSSLLFRSVDFNEFLEAITLHYHDFREQQLLVGLARTLNAPLLDRGIREVWGLPIVTSTSTGSFYAEYDFGIPGEPLCNVPTSLCGDPHTDVSPRTSARKQLDEFFQLGTGTNHCLVGDGDAHQVVADGVCSYPSLSGCEMGETAEDTQALCHP